MKRVRRLFTFALALVMTFAVSAIAFASGEGDAAATGSITVTGKSIAAGEQTTTYEIYRIFDVVANDDYSSITYKIDTKWTGFFDENAGGAKYIVNDNDTSANGGKGYTPIVVNNQVKYIALTDDNIAEFGKAALAYSQENSIQADATNTNGEFTGLELGYYMIYPKGATLNVAPYTSIVSLTTTKPNAEVVQKADYPTLEKTDDDNSVQVGQTVTYTLTSKVPDTTGFSTFDFTMHDQMTAGLTLNADSITVKIGNDDVPKTGENAYIYDSETPETGYGTAFKITIPVMKYQSKIGETITVTYTAKVNDAAVTQIDKNHAYLEYSNNPKNTDDKTTTPPDEEKVFSAKIVINKYDGSNVNAKLSGAKFILRCKSVSDTGSRAKAEAGKYYKYTEESGVQWVAANAITEKVTAGTALTESDVTNGITIKTTGTDGAASFDGLENGVYELIEIAAPAGYNQIKGVAGTITVEGNDTDTATLSTTSDIANNAGTEMPSTGGIGTTIFYVVGGVMVAGAVVFLLTKRRVNAE